MVLTSFTNHGAIVVVVVVVAAMLLLLLKNSTVFPFYCRLSTVYQLFELIDKLLATSSSL